MNSLSTDLAQSQQGANELGDHSSSPASTAIDLSDGSTVAAGSKGGGLPAASSLLQRRLDGIARRLLAEKLDRDTGKPPTGGDGHDLNGVPDDASLLRTPSDGAAGRWRRE